MIYPSKISEIIFCFPYKGVGGVSNQFLRIAEKIASSKTFKVSIVDYEDGFMAKHRTENVNLIKYDDFSTVLLSKQAIIVFQAMTPWSIFPSLNINEDSKILFWHCHPRNLMPSIPILNVDPNSYFYKLINYTFLYSYYKKLKKFHRLLIENNALIYIDGVNVDSTNIFLKVVDQNRKIIPIPVCTPNAITPQEYMNGKLKKIKLCWIGRIVDFKYHILWYTLKKLDEVSSNFNILFEIDIIGNGEYLDILKNNTLSIRKIKINFIGELDPNDISDYLQNEPDAMLAMGTSAVEGACIGLPVILLNFSYHSINNDYIFEFLHRNNKEASVGELISAKHFQKNNTSLQNCIYEIINNYQTLAIESKIYAKSIHSIDNIADMFLEHIEKVTLNWGILKKNKVLTQGFLYSAKKLLGRIQK